MMPDKYDTRYIKFHFEINSFDDFVSFVALIRGKEMVNLDDIKKLTTELNQTDKTLEDAVNKNKWGD